MILRPGKLINPSVLFKRPSFFADLSDAGSGAVDTTLRFGTGSPTFTRSTIATTIGSTGLIIPVSSGVARSYYDPTTLTYMGYLAEGARTNLLLRSEEFDNASWTKTDVTVTANSIASPDGATTADLLTQGTAGTAVTGQSVTATADVTYTASIFFKYGNNQWQYFRLRSGANVVNGWFDIQNGVAGSFTNGGTASGATGTLKAYPNGWYRCTITGAIGSGATAIATETYSVTADGNAGRAGSATCYAWGSQFENNVTFPSSYIPTTTAAVTRNADVLTYPFAGNADATVGTAYAEISSFWTTQVGTGLEAVALAFGTAGEVPFTGTGLPSTSIRVRDGTNSVIKTSLTDMSTGSRKRASAWGTGMSATGDGATPTSGSFDGSIGSTSIAVGCISAGTSQLFGPIKNVRIWTTQFTAAQLQAITS